MQHSYYFSYDGSKYIIYYAVFSFWCMIEMKELFVTCKSMSFNENWKCFFHIIFQGCNLFWISFKIVKITPQNTKSFETRKIWFGSTLKISFTAISDHICFTILSGLGFLWMVVIFSNSKKQFWRLRVLMNSFRQIAISVYAINLTSMQGF